MVQVFYQFKNEQKGGLGMPMPAGTVRVYQADSKGGVQFVGEDRHHPHAEGRDDQHQDRQCLRRRLRAEADRLPEDRDQRLRARVRSDAAQPQGRTPCPVEVNEPIGGTWEMLHASHKWTKTDAWAAQFTVPVAVDGASTLKYRVRITY